MRKIVHVDMDAFYASVEQRDDPSLRGKPVVVAWRGARSVVCAASYEARTFGIRSAMPAVRAERLCPDAVFVPPDFARYKAVSRQVREIFHRHTDLVEPLSLDEAYLDVTEAKTGMQLATEIAQLIRTQIREETQLTASAGIAPNKFLAKIASDWRKPDGQFVIAPSRVDAFLLPLPVNRIPGVGKVMDGKLAALGIVTVSDLRLRPLEELQAHFGSFGQSLYRRARGIDERPVRANRIRKSVGAENTFSADLHTGEEMRAALAPILDKVWRHCDGSGTRGRTVTLKVKYADFRQITRALSLPRPVSSRTEIEQAAFSPGNQVPGTGISPDAQRAAGGAVAGAVVAKALDEKVATGALIGAAGGALCDDVGVCAP